MLQSFPIFRDHIALKYLQLWKSVAVSLTALLVACAEIPPNQSAVEIGTSPAEQWAPADLAALVDAGDIKGANALTLRRLTEHFGTQVPNLRLRNLAGRPSFLFSEITARRTALLIAGSCPSTHEWSARIRASGWKMADTNDLVVLLLPHDDPELIADFEGGPKTFVIEWPLPDFLAYVRMYPLALFVDQDSRLIGYQKSNAPPVWMAQKGR